MDIDVGGSGMRGFFAALRMTILCRGTLKVRMTSKTCEPRFWPSYGYSRYFVRCCRNCLSPPSHERTMVCGSSPMPSSVMA